jgi:hypothetical protein
MDLDSKRDFDLRGIQDRQERTDLGVNKHGHHAVMDLDLLDPMLDLDSKSDAD